MAEQKTVLLIGAFDTKGPEYALVRSVLQNAGLAVMTMNTGVLGEAQGIAVDVPASQVAEAAGTSLDALRKSNDRGAAVKAMANGAATLAKRLYDEGKFAGVFGMGGTAGTTVATTAMRALPLGVPKVCVSTAASGDTSGYVGTKDITMVPSVVDVAGVNRVSRVILTRAAGAMAGMVKAEPEASTKDRPVIAASMFGNTTQCVDACRAALEAKGYEVLVFHATGTGGKTMESLIDEGLVDGCLDITTTEWADQICGGVFDAGPDRLAAPGRAGIPHLIVPGCIDMANFGAISTVPQKYRDANRQFYEWNPSVTLMRTNVEENRRMGEAFAEKINAGTNPVEILLPMRGVSILDGDGERFCDREADQAMFDALRSNLRREVPIWEIDANINDKAFSDVAVETMLSLMSAARTTK